MSVCIVPPGKPISWPIRGSTRCDGGLHFANFPTTGNDRVGRCVSNLVAASVLLASGAAANAQSSYRNLDAGLPVRIEDAAVTERYGLDLDFLNFRYDELSNLRTRIQLEPRMSYGILPRTEAWIRLPVFFRERTAAPRAGVAGVGAGAMYQLKLESLHLPALAVASEIFQPTGPNALPTSYSLRGLITRSFAPGRLHLNASIASFAVRAGPSLIITCPGQTVPGSGCGGTPLPPLDGPCTIGTSAGITGSLLCSAPQPGTALTTQEVPGEIQTHTHWLLGAAVDKTLPLSSTLLIADFFAEKFESIGRRTDLTTELGIRHQLRPQMVIASAVGRHFRGAGHSTFVTFGLTVNHAVQLWR